MTQAASLDLSLKISFNGRSVLKEMFFGMQILVEDIPVRDRSTGRVYRFEMKAHLVRDGAKVKPLNLRTFRSLVDNGLLEVASCRGGLVPTTTVKLATRPDVYYDLSDFGTEYIRNF